MYKLKLENCQLGMPIKYTEQSTLFCFQWSALGRKKPEYTMQQEFYCWVFNTKLYATKKMKTIRKNTKMANILIISHLFDDIRLRFLSKALCAPSTFASDSSMLSSILFTTTSLVKVHPVFYDPTFITLRDWIIKHHKFTSSKKRKPDSQFPLLCNHCSQMCKDATQFGNCRFYIV